jgi:hypothetical protein
MSFYGIRGCFKIELRDCEEEIKAKWQIIATVGVESIKVSIELS